MIRDYIRTLTVATLAVSILAVPSVPTYLPPKQKPGGGARCAYWNPDFNEWDFMLPGDMISVRDGNGNWVNMRCGISGKWVVVPFTQPGVRHVANPGGGAVWSP